MKTIEHTIDISAPPDAVWHVGTDLAPVLGTSLRRRKEVCPAMKAALSAGVMSQLSPGVI